MLDPHPTQRLSCWEMRGAQPPAASQTSNTAPVVLGASPVSDTPGTLRFSVSGSEKKKKNCLPVSAAAPAVTERGLNRHPADVLEEDGSHGSSSTAPAPWQFPEGQSGLRAVPQPRRGCSGMLPAPAG